MEGEPLIRILLLVVFALTSLCIKAEEVKLGQLLEQYRKAGYTIVYSTALVDESLVIDWDGRFSISGLRQLLEEHDLGLERSDDRWLVVPHEGEQPVLDDVVGEIAEKPIDHIVVSASRYELQGEGLSSRHLIGEGQLNDLPSFAGDTLRVVHRLPGSASLGVTAKPNVRGGSDDELLVLFDGVELIEPFHLRDFQSMFSSFHPQTIQSVEYFTGGFPARYGNKLSGVLDIATQDAFAAPGGEIGISAYTLSGLYFNETEKDRWLVSARRGNLDVIIQSKIGKPKYHDFYSRYTREIKNGSLKASLFIFDDDLLFKTDESRAKSDVKNRYVWFEWEHEPHDRRYARTFLSHGQVDSLREGLTFAEDDTEGFLIDDQSLDITSIRHLHELKLSDTFKIDFGASVSHMSMDYDTRMSVEKDIVAEFLRLPTEVDIDFDRTFTGNAWSLFSTVKLQPMERLTAEFGLRYDYQDYSSSRWQLSPRLSLLFEPNEKLDLRLSYGRFHQPQGIHELKTADGEIDFFKPQQSDHLILAAEYQLSDNSRLVGELFYKKVDDLKPRYTNLFDPYVYVPELEQDRIVVRASEAEARGFELSYTGETETFQWNVNYTYSEVQDMENGRWIDRRWDQTHNLNVFMNWYIGNWTIGVATAWHTGWAATRLPLEYPAGDPFVISDFRNNDRLKEYGTLDFKVVYDQELSNSTLQYFLEVTNIVSRANKGGLDYEIELEDDTYQLAEVDVQPVFPLVTNIGIIWRF